MDRIDGKYAFSVSLADDEPDSLISRLLSVMGYMSHETCAKREAKLINAANNHIFSTVICDRKAYLEALKAERKVLGEESHKMCGLVNSTHIRGEDAVENMD